MKQTTRYTIAAFAGSAFLFAMTGCDADNRSDGHHMDGGDHHSTTHDATMPNHDGTSDDQHNATPDTQQPKP